MAQIERTQPRRLPRSGQDEPSAAFSRRLRSKFLFLQAACVFLARSQLSCSDTLILRQKCFDCATVPSNWASTTYGIFICLECSGKHRSLGTHISRVKSITLDRWDAAATWAMKFGGNARAKSQFTKEYANFGEKYNSDEASAYAAKLKAEISSHLGLPASDTSKPAPTNSGADSSISDPRLRQYQGATSIGSSDLNGRRDDDNQSSCWGCC